MAHLLSQQSSLLLAPDTPGSTQTIDIDESVHYQPFDGVGGAMTDTSAWLLSSVVPSQVRLPLMTQLFDSVSGIGLSNLRLPIGASDFSLSHYTYDDVPASQADYSLSQFSTAHDQAYIIPMLQLARQINPDIRMLATPWSPPAWMKTTGSLYAGSLKTDSATQTTLANYFVRFLQDYAAAGIPIQRITPQNEPLLQDGTYPTMLMDGATESTFIANYLAPALASAHLPAEIVAYDHNWDNTTYPISVLGGTAGSVVSGTAYHCYAGRPDAMTLVHAQFPAKDIHLSECSADTLTSGFLRNLRYDMQTLIVGALRNWTRTILKWNLILDTAHGPHTGGCANCSGCSRSIARRRRRPSCTTTTSTRSATLAGSSSRARFASRRTPSAPTTSKTSP
jgi:glucosylceramidase